MKTLTRLGLFLVITVGFSMAVHAVPKLQVGAPASGGNCATGPYAPYSGSSSDPTEEQTFITSGNTLCVTGEYKANLNPLKLGGQFDSGDNYSDHIVPTSTAFDSTDGAILVATVAEDELADAIANLSISGATLITSSTDNSYFPNNHAPTNQTTSAYLFFDIGNFYDLGLDGAGTAPTDTIVNHTDTADTTIGVNKELTLQTTGSLSWIHFDVMALLTTCDGTGSDKCGLDAITQLVSTFDTDLINNPGSHDTTWKPGDDDDDDDDVPSIPEPSILALLGFGLAGVGVFRIRRRQS